MAGTLDAFTMWQIMGAVIAGNALSLTFLWAIRELQHHRDAERFAPWSVILAGILPCAVAAAGWALIP